MYINRHIAQEEAMIERSSSSRIEISVRIVTLIAVYRRKADANGIHDEAMKLNRQRPHIPACRGDSRIFLPIWPGSFLVPVKRLDL